MTPVTVTRGAGPVVLGVPHAGTWLPDDAFAGLNVRGRALADTDWHVDRLYDGLVPGVTMVRANFHRYAIDANRDPGGASLYPGQNTTGLIPATDFDGAPIRDRAPTLQEEAARVATLHAPYHAALAAELDRVRAIHGMAILWDCHSIRSRIPFLFDGVLPDFNIGTDNGATCAPIIREEIAQICQSVPGTRSTVDGRFRGGWSTRHYGRPASGLHAIQMELAQSLYLRAEEPPWTPDSEKWDRLRATLARCLAALQSLAPLLKDRP